MPQKQRKLKLGLRHVLPVFVVAIVGGSVAFYGTTQVKPSHADTAAYYSCNAGDTLSGSTCTHTSTYTGTYHASQPYCYENSSDTYLEITNSCSYPATATTTYTCKSGDSGGGTSSNCYHIYPKPASGCGNDIYYFYSECEHIYSGTASTTYKCRNSSDYMNTQYHNCSYTASTTSAYYSCNNGDTQSGSTCYHTTTYAATYHPAVITTNTSSGGNTSSGSTGSTSGSTSTKKTTTTSTKSTNTPVTITPVQPPSAPTGLKTDVVSSKVVELTWTAGQAAAGVQNYEIERSLDGATWTPLGITSATSYSDTTTDFATKYFYRVREVDNSGADSDYATATTTTGRFSSSGSKVISDDKLVTVFIPSGAFDQEVSCSITSPDGSLPTVPTKSLLIGPYSVLCISPDGTTIGSFKKPLTVTMDLSGASNGYGGVTARLYDDTTTSDAKSTYDAKAHKISFELAANKSFAVYGKKQGSGFMPILLVILLIGGLGGALYLRKFWGGRARPASQPQVSIATMPASAPAAASLAVAAAPNAQSFFEQAVNKPNCTHLNMAHQVQPQSSGCAECTAEHKKWNALRICLTCGHVGCSDDSVEQHALKHYQQTGHPLIYEYGNPKGDGIGWCYIDQTYI